MIRHMVRICVSVLCGIVILTACTLRPRTAPSATSTTATSTPAAPTSATPMTPSLSTSKPVEPQLRPVTRADGYRGCWYQQQPIHPQDRFRLAGGLATFSSRHLPAACYDAKANKTFFVFAAAADDKTPAKPRPLRIMVAYYDHATGKVPRPAVLREDPSGDPRHNAAIAIDDTGHVWVFSAGERSDYPAVIFKNAEPHDIGAFQKVQQTSFAYPQAWFVPKQGFLLVHTRHVEGQPNLYAITSSDGINFSEPQLLAEMPAGGQCISGQFRNKIGVAIAYDTPKRFPDGPTGLYYIETLDFGKTWRTAGNKRVQLPLKLTDEKAQVRNYERFGRLIFLQDMSFNAFGYPVILYIMSNQKERRYHQPTCTWSTALWTRRGWETGGVLESDNNHDTGCLYMERRAWHIIAPTLPGPQPFSAGGDVVRWTTQDAGRSWYPQRLTPNDEFNRFNHNFVRRPVNAHDDFYVFWADGDTRQPCESRLYFADKIGNVYQLPTAMSRDFEQPKLIWKTTYRPPPEPETHPKSRPAK